MPNPIKLSAWLNVAGVAPGGTNAQFAHGLRINAEAGVPPRYVAYGADFGPTIDPTLGAALSAVAGLALSGVAVLWDATNVYLRNNHATLTTVGHIYVGREKTDDQPNSPAYTNTGGIG